MDWIFYTRSQLEDLEPARLKDVHINIFYHRCYPQFQRYCVNHAPDDDELRHILDAADGKTFKTDGKYMLLTIVRFQSFLKVKEEAEDEEQTPASTSERSRAPNIQGAHVEQTLASTRKRRRVPENQRFHPVGSSVAKGAAGQAATALTDVPVALALPLGVDQRGYMLLRHNMFSVTRRRGENCVLDAVAQALGDPTVVSLRKLRAFAKSCDCHGCDVRSLPFVARFLRGAKTPYDLVNDAATQSGEDLFRASPAIRLVSYEMPQRRFHCVVFDTFRRLLVDNDEDPARRYYHWDQAMASDGLKASSLLEERYGFLRLREVYIVKVHAKRLHETCHDRH